MKMKKLKYASILALGAIALTSCGSSALVRGDVENIIANYYNMSSNDYPEWENGRELELNPEYRDTEERPEGVDEAAFNLARNFRDDVVGSPYDTSFYANYMRQERLESILGRDEEYKGNLYYVTQKWFTPNFYVEGKAVEFDVSGSYTPEQLPNYGVAFYLAVHACDIGLIDEVELVVSVKGRYNEATKEYEASYLGNFSYAVHWSKKSSN